VKFVSSRSAYLVDYWSSIFLILFWTGQVSFLIIVGGRLRLAAAHSPVRPVTFMRIKTIAGTLAALTLIARRGTDITAGVIALFKEKTKQ
jgi:hypothetical protein